MLCLLSCVLHCLALPSLYRVFHNFNKSKILCCREVFADFDPIVVAKLNEKKTLAPGSTACSLLSELKLRGIIENARQMLKVNLLSIQLELVDTSTSIEFVCHLLICIRVWLTSTIQDKHLYEFQLIGTPSPKFKGKKNQRECSFYVACHKKFLKQNYDFIRSLVLPRTTLNSFYLC